MQIVINYSSGARSFRITPSRKVAVKRLAKKSFPSFASSVVNTYTNETLKAVGKKIREEISHLSSDATNSILKDDKEQIINFSWNKLYSEFLTHTPCLVNLLHLINPKVSCYKPVMCILISMMAKCHNPKLALLQRVFSVFLYGSGVHKEVS